MKTNSYYKGYFDVSKIRDYQASNNTVTIVYKDGSVEYHHYENQVDTVNALYDLHRDMCDYRAKL